LYSLCTEVKNIIIDLESLDSIYIENKDFTNLLQDIQENYNLFLISNGIHNIRGFELINQSFNDFDSISSFINEFELEPMHTIILTSSTLCVEQAHMFNISTILVVEEMLDTIDNKYLPDKILNINGLRSLLIEKNIIGNFNELSTEQTGGDGCVYQIGEIIHQLSEDVKANLMYAGRYFTYDDPRSYTHCLTNMLLRLKNFKPYAVESLAFCMNANINSTRKLLNDINLIAVVPAKTGCDNHLDHIMNHPKLIDHSSIIDTNLLFTVRDYEKQKHAGSFIDRANNVLDAFDARENIQGHVLLVDDILTSGSTMMECAKVLYKYGAEKVTILPLAIMQSKSNAIYHNKIRDSSNQEYRLNFRISDGNPFWVASNGEFLNFNIGKEQFLSQNRG
jgi:hypothetical protein